MAPKPEPWDTTGSYMSSDFGWMDSFRTVSDLRVRSVVRGTVQLTHSQGLVHIVPIVNPPQRRPDPNARRRARLHPGLEA